jgi:ribonuclease VapC
MFVDAAAIIAILSDEKEANRCSEAIAGAGERMTSAIAVWEAAVGLARPDKLGISVETSGRMVVRFLEERGIAVSELPEAAQAVALSLSAAQRFRSGANRLNLADCFHYACAKHYEMPILSTADEFRFTDIETVP